MAASANISEHVLNAQKNIMKIQCNQKGNRFSEILHYLTLLILQLLNFSQKQSPGGVL